MTDSQFLYQLMLRVNENRAVQRVPSVGGLVLATGTLIEAIETGKDDDAQRSAALNAAAQALRYAVEGWEVGGKKGL